jgi:hypothetical protein
VAIVDTSYGGDEPPGVYADSAEDTLAHLSPESLSVVGEVTLDALDHISRRLAKIDRFSRAPLEEESPPTPAPAQEPTDAGAGGGTAEKPEGEAATDAAGGSSATEWEGEAVPPVPPRDAAQDPSPPPPPPPPGQL